MGRTPDLFSGEPEPRRIAHVYPFDSGAMFVFDQHNELITEYCGTRDHVEAAVLRDAPRDAVWHE